MRTKLIKSFKIKEEVNETYNKIYNQELLENIRYRCLLEEIHNTYELDKDMIRKIKRQLKVKK